MKLSKNGHVVETSLKREAVRLVAEGYVHVNDAPALNLDDLASELGLSVITNNTGESEHVAPKPSPKTSK